MAALVIVSDDPLIHLIVNKYVIDYPQIDVAECLDGMVVIEYLTLNADHAEKLPDFILLDLDMPGFSGWDFLDKFKELRLLLSKSIAIYTLTSMTDPIARLSAWIYPNVRGVFHKPFRPHMLQSFISK